jgi:carbonic anhydrase
LVAEQVQAAATPSSTYQRCHCSYSLTTVHTTYFMLHSFTSKAAQLVAHLCHHVSLLLLYCLQLIIADSAGTSSLGVPEHILAYRRSSSTGIMLTAVFSKLMTE